MAITSNRFIFRIADGKRPEILLNDEPVHGVLKVELTSVPTDFPKVVLTIKATEIEFDVDKSELSFVPVFARVSPPE